MEECKHGLAVGTCAYCSGLVKTPSATGRCQDTLSLIKAGESNSRLKIYAQRQTRDHARGEGRD